MNKQTLFHIKIIAKKQALESIIQDTLNLIDDVRYTSTKNFWLNQEIIYRAKLDLINEIIEEYLNN
jgi:hypothetical protein